VNRAAVEITGYSRDELLKMRFDELAEPGNQDVPTELRNLKISGGQETTTYELEIVRKDGKRITLENSTRLMFEHGRAVGFQGVGREISERKKLQEQLRVAQKMEAVGRFAGGIAHDFGNVLTIINGYCALILNRTRKDDPMRSEIEGIQRAGQRAASLIRHLLTFSKGQIFRPRPMRIDAALSDMHLMLERLVGEDIRLIVRVSDGIGTIRFDPTQWEQIIVNLALNARDSMPAGGRLTIEAKPVDLGEPLPTDDDKLPAGRYIALTVIDTGHGMSQEVLAQIFEPFFSTKEHGTGLGLSTVYGIVKQAGGRISAESQIHAGTTVQILLPCMEETVDHVEAHLPHGNMTRGTEIILLAEDEEDVRHLIREMLRYSGYTVLEAIDPGHAVQICENRHQKIDLLLTDVVMPHVSGPQLAAAVRRIRPKLKVMYMSGYPRDKFEKEGFQTDIIHFIQKPLTAETLMPLIRDVLDGSDKG
jgi:PAS domain S-box-containing protein